MARVARGLSLALASGIIILWKSAPAQAQSTCSTGGGGTVSVPPDRRASGTTANECQDCGPEPCVSADPNGGSDVCWSCCSSNGVTISFFEFYCPDPGGGSAVCSHQPCTGPPPPPPPPPPPLPSPSPDGPPSPPPSSSGATGQWTLNVWYGIDSGSPGCDASTQPAATATFASADCNCLVTVDDVCFASATLKVTDADTIDAEVYAGGGCDGIQVGGDTDIQCGNCTTASISALGQTGWVGFQIVCPFTAWGLCPQASIPAGVDCYIASGLACGVALCVLCTLCSCRGKRNTPATRAAVTAHSPSLSTPIVSVQRQQPSTPVGVHAPLLSGVQDSTVAGGISCIGRYGRDTGRLTSMRSRPKWP